MNNLTAAEGIFGTIITVFHSVIASVGIIGNFTVILVFLNHQKFRRKILNIVHSQSGEYTRKIFTTIDCVRKESVYGQNIFFVCFYKPIIH